MLNPRDFQLGKFIVCSVDNTIDAVSENDMSVTEHIFENMRFETCCDHEGIAIANAKAIVHQKHRVWAVVVQPVAKLKGGIASDWNIVHRIIPNAMIKRTDGGKRMIDLDRFIEMSKEDSLHLDWRERGHSISFIHNGFLLSLQRHPEMYEYKIFWVIDGKNYEKKETNVQPEAYRMAEEWFKELSSRHLNMSLKHDICVKDKEDRVIWLRRVLVGPKESSFTRVDKPDAVMKSK